MKWLERFQRADTWSEPAWRAGFRVPRAGGDGPIALPAGRDGFLVQGANLESLLVSAAQQLFAAQVKPRGRPAQVLDPRSVGVEGRDATELLVNWLNVLLALFRRDGFVPSAFDIYDLDSTSLSADIEGLFYTAEHYDLGTLVARVQQDGTEVRKVRGLWHAAVVIET